MFKEFLTTAAVIISTSYGALSEIVEIQDPLDPSTLISTIPYREHLPSYEGASAFPESLSFETSLNSWEVWKGLRSTLIEEAGLILSKLKDSDRLKRFNTIESQLALKHIFWNRIRLLRVWHHEFIRAVFTLADGDHNDKVYQILSNISPFYIGIITFSARFNSDDNEPFKLRVGQSWTGTHECDPNLKLLRLLQAFLNLNPQNEELELLPDEVPLARVIIPSLSISRNIDISCLTFDQHTQIFANIPRIIPNDSLSCVNDDFLNEVLQTSKQFEESESNEPLPKKFGVIRTFTCACTSILEDIVPLENSEVDVQILHQLFWNNFNLFHSALATILTQGKIQESSRNSLHRMYSRLVYFLNLVNQNSLEYFRRPKCEIEHRLFSESLEGRSHFYPNERFRILFRSIFD
jgi:hypothetical protein